MNGTELGFKNAPGIKYWAVGMEFQWLTARYRVINVLEDGQCAMTLLLSSDANDDRPYSKWQSFGRYEDRGSSILDLKSVWEGRKYKRYEDGICTVVWSNSQYIVYKICGAVYCEFKDSFLNLCSPIPISSPMDLKAGDIVEVEWKKKDNRIDKIPAYGLVEYISQDRFKIKNDDRIIAYDQVIIHKLVREKKDK